MNKYFTKILIASGLLILLGAGCAKPAPEEQAPQEQTPVAVGEQDATRVDSDMIEAQRCLITPDLIRQYCGVEGTLTKSDHSCVVDNYGIPFATVIFYNRSSVDDVISGKLQAGNTVARKFDFAPCEALATRQVANLGDKAMLVGGCANNVGTDIDRAFSLLVQKGSYTGEFVAYLGDRGEDWRGKSNNGCSTQEAQNLAREVIVPELERLDR